MLLCFSLHLDVHNHYSPYTSKQTLSFPTHYIFPIISTAVLFQCNNGTTCKLYIYTELGMHQIVFPPSRKKPEDEQNIYAAAFK